MYEKVYSSFYCTHFAVLILNSGTEKSMVYWQDMILETKSTDTYKEMLQDHSGSSPSLLVSTDFKLAASLSKSTKVYMGSSLVPLRKAG
jgi:hypothetical protein